MGRLHLTCDTAYLDTVTGECSSPVWAESPSVLDALPSREDANAVGAALFGACFLLYAAKKLLAPPSDHDSDG